jgi:putative methionine-R-sulfoxide reductase with GAF domain/two-component sensor histidine kinase
MKEFLIVIEEESNRLMALIEDILDFSQMESGAVRFERTSCNMNELVTVAANELEKNFESKRITLHTQLPQGEVKVRAERDLMKQLVINLLHNASKFTPEGGHVWVTIEDEVVSARIVVEDNGIGIPEDQLERIFDHFHQADGSATRRHGGTGIGLAICKNIVEWHDGRIWVENVAGKGARFVVVIPKKQAVVRSEVLTDYVSTRRFEVERYMELVVELIAELLNVKRASLMMVDPEAGELRIDSAIGLDEDIVEHARVRLGESIAGTVAQENSAYLVQDVQEDQRLRTAGRRYESTSFLSVPIRRENRVVGVINVTDPVGRPALNEEDHALLELFADRVVMALDALSRFKEKSREFEDVRSTFKSILDAKRYINTHNADALSLVIHDTAQRLGMTPEESATLRYTFHVTISASPRWDTTSSTSRASSRTRTASTWSSTRSSAKKCSSRSSSSRACATRCSTTTRTSTAPVIRENSPAKEFRWMHAYFASRTRSARWYHTVPTRSGTRWARRSRF